MGRIAPRPLPPAGWLQIGVRSALPARGVTQERSASPKVGLSTSGPSWSRRRTMVQRHVSEDPTSAPVIIGVDPHKASHTAAVLGPRRQPLAHLRIPSDRAGYQQLRHWSARWPHRLWAVENTAGLGNSLAQWLLSDGEQVVDVPAKLSARVRLLSTGHGRKTDQADAVSTALAACSTAELQQAAMEEHT